MSELFWFVGVKFGKSSKLTRKVPCSPHPPVGLAVADEAGNELFEPVVDFVLVVRVYE